MRKVSLIAGIFLLFIFSSASAQQKEVTGIITDSTGSRLSGVTVRLKDTNIGTTTNNSGKYSITIPEKDAVLQISSVGYIQKEIPVHGSTVVDVVLVPDQQGKKLNEVVIVGYQKIKEKYLTGSVSTVSGDELSPVPATNLSNSIGGRLPDVYVTQSTGAPGISSNVRIGAATSWNGSPPILVIDGVIRDQQAFDQLSVNEVSKISVLKDAAAAAIYGARSSNGVFLVTTKSGSSGKPLIQINSSYSFEEPTFHDKVLSDYESHILNNVYWQKQTGTNWFGEDEIKAFKDSGYSTNYLEYLYRPPSTKNTSISVFGGNEKIRFYVGGSYIDQTGFLENMDYSKYNIRANINASLVKNLEIGLNISTANSTRHQFNSSSTDVRDWYGKLKYLFYYIPITIDGNLVSPGWQVNLVGMVNGEGGYVSDKNQDINALFHVKYDVPFIKGLSLIGKYNKNNTQNFVKVFSKKQTEYKYKRTGSTGKVYTKELIGPIKTPFPSRESLSNSLGKTDSYQFNAELLYVRDFRENSINAAVIYEEYDLGASKFNLTRYDFPLIVRDQFFATSDDAVNSAGNGSEYYLGRKSFVASVNYRFKDRYLFASSLRADGSMLFAPDKRWGYFPSLSAGWIISEESFFKNSMPTFRYFKIRGSLGYTGNDAVGGWQWQQAYYKSGQYFLGGSNQNIIRSGGIVNSDLTWERSRAINLGVDILTNFNLGLQVDFWKRHTSDILGRRIVLLPTTFGATLPDENYGEMNSQGYNLEITYGNKLRNLKYDIKGNLSFATNKVVKADFASNGLAVDNPNGKTLGYIATYRSSGIIRTQKELDALPQGYTILGRKPTLGSLNYEDISGVDGVPDGKIDTYDRQVISNYGMNNIPYSAGLNFDLRWKDFSASIFFQSLFGFKKLYTDNWGRGFPLDARLYAFWGDTWSKENPDATYPAISGPADPPSSMSSSFWYEDASFIRLKNLSLGYNLPRNLLNHINFKEVKFYISATNLFYLSSFHWYDPEIPSLASYPNMKQFSVGLNITL